MDIFSTISQIPLKKKEMKSEAKNFWGRWRGKWQKSREPWQLKHTNLTHFSETSV